jgi:MFS transporter, FHS family, Na+ dependent glucose transporter 1
VSTETAASSAAPSRHENLAITGVYYAAFIILGLASAIIGPTLPFLAENTRTPLALVSYLFVIHSLGYLGGSLLGGELYDRLSGHKVLFLAVTLIGASLALLPLAPFLWVLLVVAGVLGMSMGALDVGANTLLVWVHRRGVGPYMNGLHFSFGVGAFLAPLLVAAALKLFGGAVGGYWAVSLLAIPVALLLLRWRSPRRQNGKDSGVPTHTRAAWVLVALIALFLFLYVSGEASYGAWVFTYAFQSNVVPVETSAAYLTSAFWGALTAGRLLAIPLAARFKPGPILAVDTLGCLASLGLILLAPHSPLVLWIATIGLGLSMASIFPTAITLAEFYIPITGRVNSFFFVGASLGGMGLPWLIGQMFEPLGPLSMPASILFALVLMGLLLGGVLAQGRAVRAARTGD